MENMTQAQVNGIRTGLTQAISDFITGQETETWRDTFGWYGPNMDALMAEAALSVLLAIHDAQVEASSNGVNMEPEPA